MKILNKFLSLIYFCLVSFTVVLFLQICYYSEAIPDNFYREKMASGSFGVGAYPNITVKSAVNSITPAYMGESASDTMTVMLYGIFPVKDVTVKRADTPALVPSGKLLD